MSLAYSSNMNLPIPGVGTESGPAYATDINSCLTIIDQHSHIAGSGVPITPAAININTSLTFQNEFAVDLAGLTLSAQVSTPANNTIYESGVDLYFVDGNGNNVRITQSGGIAGSPGSIANLTSPASASYVSASSTFVWQSDTSVAANMDCGSVLLRNLSPNSTFAVTLQAPASLSSNYSVVLPTLPASQKIMTLDASGNMSAPYVVDNSTLQISANTIQVKDSGITLAKMANLAASKLIGRATASTGVPEAVGLGTGLAMSGGNLVVTPDAGLVTTVSVSSASSTTISGLDGNTDKVYYIVMDGQWSGSDAILMYMQFNGDGTASNYFGVQTFWYSGGQVTNNSGAVGGLYILRKGFATTNYLTAEFTVRATTASGARTFFGEAGWYTPGSNGGYQNAGGGWSNTSSNITSITLNYGGGTFTGTINVYTGRP